MTQHKGGLRANAHRAGQWTPLAMLYNTASIAVMPNFPLHDTLKLELIQSNCLQKQVLFRVNNLIGVAQATWKLRSCG